MRNTIFTLAAAQLALFIALALSKLGDHPARSVDGGLAAGTITLVGLVLAVFLTPAIILAIVKRGLKAALILTLIPPILYVLFIGLGGL